ncbi:ATP-binding protein [Streptomyces sp. GC420]|uniref:ATP-binding protein n=1 Tax=Streptomyces sp. GC420 TaxID=2697568 RepID=UPI001415271C|nr:ATP-binding protein [Streptomyces sp. GC420]
MPPPPQRPPLAAGEGFLAWLRAPRPEAAPGIWRYGHKAKPPEEPDRVPGRQLLAGALIAFLAGWLLWSLLWNGYLGDYWLWPLLAVLPDDWRVSHDGEPVIAFAVAQYVYVAAWVIGFLVVFGRLGRWAEVWRRYGAPALRRVREQDAATQPPAPQEDPAQWPQLRTAGAADAAERLAGDARAGLMNDVDHSRIERAWESVRSGRNTLGAFTDAVLRDGSGACAHPSGARDLPARAAAHDLAVRQVRLGTTAEDPRNPYQHRGTGLALGPELLGTSLLAVGPAGSGKTGRLVWPVVESLCLQALANRAAVVVVGAAGAGRGPAADFDVVVRVGHPDSVHDLDLYGGTADPDEAAGILAEALVGDLAEDGGRRATTALGQLLGPFRAVHGRFPSVPELRELLDGAPEAIAELREGLRAAGNRSLERELDARERQAGSHGDPGVLLADRIALLDRPAFSGFFDTTGRSRPFSLRSLEHPVRVRVDLPERGHSDACRILTRLVLAQFTESAAAREDRSLFACLVLDDASHTVTTNAVRGIQRLRSANAGVVMTLRSLDDVPGPLRSALLGAVGCRMALSGVTTWDGQHFADVWGKEWVEARDITNRQIISEEPLGKAVHFIRRVVTGKHVTAESVTVRQVERERWSASDLAHAVPPGHAVVSLTTVRGEHAPPLLVDLRN